MKIYEVINFNRELLSRICGLGIRLSDVQYIDIYNEYDSMCISGEKVTYIVASLSEKYSLSERKVYQLIKAFRMDAAPLVQRDCT